MIVNGNMMMIIIMIVVVEVKAIGHTILVTNSIVEKFLTEKMIVNIIVEMI